MVNFDLNIPPGSVWLGFTETRLLIRIKRFIQLHLTVPPSIWVANCDSWRVSPARTQSESINYKSIGFQLQRRSVRAESSHKQWNTKGFIDRRSDKCSECFLFSIIWPITINRFPILLIRVPVVPVRQWRWTNDCSGTEPRPRECARSNEVEFYGKLACDCSTDKRKTFVQTPKKGQSNATRLNMQRLPSISVYCK